MSIDLTPEQQEAIQRAIQSGALRSIDEFIDSAISALLRSESGFDKKRAQQAGERMRELRKGVALDLDGMSIRELAHTGHRY